MSKHQDMIANNKFELTSELKQNAFTTPEGYFDTLYDRLVDGVIAAAPQKQPSWFKALRPQLAFAMSFIALVVAGYGGLTLLNYLAPAHDATVPASLDDFYVSAFDMLNVDEQTMLHVMADEEKIDLSVNTEEIINYLASTHVSLADIASLE
jgi:hypothetical protein